MRRWIESILSAALVAAALASTPASAVTDNSLITLGTMGGPVPSPVRSQPANVLLRADKAYLVDVSDGTVQQLAKAGVKLGDVRAIFISHLHADHIGGLEAVLGLRIQMVIQGVVSIYGLPGKQQLVAGIAAALQPSAQAAYGITGRRYAPPESTSRWSS